MMNKRTIGIASIALVALLGAAWGVRTISAPQPQQRSSDQIISLEQLIEDSDSLHIEATYSDAVENFVQLENNAEYIVCATVVSTNMKSKIAQEAELSVNEVYKGTVSDTITLYQIATDNLVESGKQYILFMNPQWPDNLEREVYYPVGGGIGVLEVEASTMNIYVDEERIISSDLAAWVEENLVSSANRSNQPQYEISVH